MTTADSVMRGHGIPAGHAHQHHQPNHHEQLVLLPANPPDSISPVVLGRPVSLGLVHAYPHGSTDSPREVDATCDMAAPSAGDAGSLLILRRLRAAWSGLRSGRAYDPERTYEAGFTLGRKLGVDRGIKLGFDAAFNDIHNQLPAIIDARLNARTAVNTRTHLTLVGGATR